MTPIFIRPPRTCMERKNFAHIQARGNLDQLQNSEVAHPSALPRKLHFGCIYSHCESGPLVAVEHNLALTRMHPWPNHDDVHGPVRSEKRASTSNVQNSDGKLSACETGVSRTCAFCTETNVSS